MNKRGFNSINDFMEYKKNLELSSEFIFIQYLNVIYSNLLLREELFYQVHRRKSQELKMDRKILLTSFKRNSLTRKIPQRLKIIDKGICLKTFLEYIDLQEFIGERIFNYLNKSKKITLNKDDFTNGMNKIYYGDIKNLIKLTFFLCDFNDDGKIYKSDMKLLLAYIPSFTEFFQKLKIKQINKIINTFFEEKIENPEKDTEEEINFDDYSKYILEYNDNNNNLNSTELLNDYNNNGPFFYFISILSYLFKNCPFSVKNVDYFIYSKKKLKLKIIRNDFRSSSVKQIFLTTAKKIKYNNYLNLNSNNKLDLSSNELINIKLDKNRYENNSLSKITQKNLFNNVQKSNSDKYNDKSININFKIKGKSNNKEYIISKAKNEVNMFKKSKENFMIKNRLKKSQKNLPSFRDMTFNKKQKDSSLFNSPYMNDYSQSPQLLLKKNSSNEESLSNSNKNINNNLINLRYNNPKNKLPIITKEKYSPLSVQIKSKEEDGLKGLEELVLCEYSGNEDNNSDKNIEINRENIGFNEAYLYKFCEDVNDEQKILNKFYAVLSEKEILFFSSDLKNEFCDLWYIYKSNISLGKERYNNQTYYTINITFFNNSYVNKLYFLNVNICKNFANKIKQSIHNLNFSDFYELQEKLGQGTFGTVNKCKNKSSGQIFAVKIINKNELKMIDLQLIQQEKNYLSLIKHPNIISLKDYFEDKTNIYLVTECCNGGDLLTFIENKRKNNIRITEKMTAKIIRKIAEGIKYLNFFGIVHRDIKPENILFSEENEITSLKIIDLGVCQTLTHGQMANEPIGTNGYIPPEIYLKNDYSYKVDIWSLGIILYLLTTEGFLPFDDENMDYEVIGKKVLFLQQEYPEEYFGKKSQGLITLLYKMLEKIPYKRIDINNLMKDSWFNIIKN